MSLLVVALFAKGLATETPLLRIAIPHNRLVQTEEGYFFASETYGHIHLDNLHSDKKGLYTLCNISFVCPACSTLTPNCPDHCQVCGLDEWLLEGEESDTLLVEALLFEMTINPFSYETIWYLCEGHGSINVDVQGDTDGNCSGSASITYTDDDTKASFEGSVTVEKDPDGHTKAIGQAGFSIDF